MDAELAEINRFIASVAPFDLLTNQEIEAVTKLVSIVYLRCGTALPLENSTEPELYIVRKGALTYLEPNGELLGKYGEGDLCTVFSKVPVSTDISVMIDEDALLYVLSFNQLMTLTEKNTHFIAFFQRSAAQRLKSKVNDLTEDAIIHSTLMNTSIKHFFQSPAITIEQEQSIQQAAKKMTELNLSSLLVTQKGQLVGIITDKDIRKRCVAQGVPITQAINQIMTTDLLHIDYDANAFDALVMMTTQKVHHLPVMRSGDLVGMVTSTDLMIQEGQNAVHLTSVIHKAKSIAELARIGRMMPRLQVKMARLGTTAEHVGKNISAITTAFTIKLIELAEKLLGPAPVPYAWVAAGSQARQEQFCHSDQDNGLIISDSMKPEHDYWFHDLATFVSDGLAACGFVYCPGDVMATNTKWRQPQKVWRKYFQKWVETPSPKALMHCSIFFDLATVYGDRQLLQDIRSEMLTKTKGNTLFLAHLTKNALNLRPPLGFFRDFVLVPNGNNKATLDLKHSGIAPIVDLARIYALSEGIAAVNTKERLRAASGSPSLSKEAGANLVDAFEFLGMLRISHQSKQISAGELPDNFLPPKEISKLEREHLKDAFKVIKTLQNVRQAAY